MPDRRAKVPGRSRSGLRVLRFNPRLREYLLNFLTMVTISYSCSYITQSFLPISWEKGNAPLAQKAEKDRRPAAMLSLQCAKFPSPPPTSPPTRLAQRPFLVWQAASCLRFLRGHAKRTANSGPSGCDEYAPGTPPPKHEQESVGRSLRRRRMEAAGCRNRLAQLPRAF